MGELSRMINSQEIDLCQFFTMHPFSATEKIIYDHALKQVDFFKELYIQSNKTYEHLAETVAIVNNTAKNLLVITGYRGCGKTNFLHLIKHLAEGNEDLVNYSKLWNEELSEAKDIEDLRESINEKYENSLKRMRLIFSGEFVDMNSDNIYEELLSYIPKKLNGRYQYINFDEGGMGREKPFSIKLFYMMRKSIAKSIEKDAFDKRVTLITSFVDRNKWNIRENFENIDYSTLENFWKQIKGFLYGNVIEDDLYKVLLPELKKLSLEQLLFVYTIWDYSELLTDYQDGEGKFVYLMDNIDIISDDVSDIFKNTMMGVWKYIWDSRNVFAAIKNNGITEDLAFVEVYERSKFIVAMRETTAMHISGHLRERMRALMEHFDMSMDVDEARIMKKKIDLAQKLSANEEVRNSDFINTIRNINYLNADRMLMKNLFQINNNDYRVSSRAICTICHENEKEIGAAIQLIGSKNDDKIFGGRAIVYHLLLKSFFIEWNYFSAMGIDSVRVPNHPRALCKDYGYSCARVILTILCNRQDKRQERFFINPEESVRLSDFRSMMGNIFEIEDFVKIIDGMYGLRNKRFWNHLITFDNIQVYAPKYVQDFLTSESRADEREEIYIRATPAGQLFADLLCVHFEYFAVRFSSLAELRPLFLFTRLDDKKQCTNMKRLVSEVYEAVKSCCAKLQIYNERVLKEQKQHHYREVVNSYFYFEHQFHEERIIHNHISYLEAYRHYVLNLQLDTQTKSCVNKFLLGIIKKYLGLLMYDPNAGVPIIRDLFYSENSKQLFNELSVCIEKIEKSPDRMQTIEITRNYYNRNFQGEKCAFFVKRGFDD